jgi:hypothetical protein
MLKRVKLVNSYYPCFSVSKDRYNGLGIESHLVSLGAGGG